MKVLFMQSSDQRVYRPMIDVTSRTVREYCARHAYDYDCFLGILRGRQPWHAALNRIPMLKALAASGYLGWVIYLDADAYIFDLAFDLEGFLAGHADAALVAAGSGRQPQHWWDVNNGVFAINLRHPGAHAIIAGWNARLDRIDPDRLCEEARWGMVTDDQAILHEVLQEVGGGEAFVRIDHADVFNYNARFIRQVLRSHYTDFGSRLAKLRAVVALVMAGCDDGTGGSVATVDTSFMFEEIARSLYRALLGREADPEGLAGAVSGLRTGQRSIEGQILATLACEEFRHRLPQFLAQYGKQDGAA